MAVASIAANAYAAAQRLGAGPSPALKPPTGGDAGGGSFAGLLEQAMGSVVGAGQAADAASASAASGKASLVDLVTAVSESETAMQTLVSVRDRVISAYQEIMRMPI